MLVRAVSGCEKVLCCHGMNEEELRLVYKSFVLAKLMYASPAWWGFATATKKKHIEAFVQRGVRLGLYLATTTQHLQNLPPMAMTTSSKAYCIIATMY